jgi:hypothetical protein
MVEKGLYSPFSNFSIKVERSIEQVFSSGSQITGGILNIEKFSSSTQSSNRRRYLGFRCFANPSVKSILALKASNE